MKIFLTDQQHKLPEYLEDLRSVPIMPYRREQLKEITSSITLGVGEGIFERAVGSVLAYQIFPLSIMRHLTEWSQAGRAIVLDDTIVQQVHIPPLLGSSQKLVFGVRISAIIAEPDRRGFTYETLVGHVEKGLSTFTVERAKDAVTFRIHTLSAPGTLIASLAAPFFSRPYQAFCTRRALEHVRRLVVGPSPQDHA